MDSISTSSLQAIADAPTSDLIRMAQGAGSLSSLKHGRRHHGRRHHRAHSYSTSSLGRRATSSLLREVGAGSSSLSPRRRHSYSTSSLGRRPTSSLLREVGAGSSLPSTSSLVMSLGPTTSSLRRSRSRSGHSYAHRALKHALAVANARV